MLFQQNVATGSPAPIPSRASARASRPAFCATTAYEARRVPVPVQVTHSLRPYTRAPCRMIAPMVSGPSCMVLRIICRRPLGNPVLHAHTLRLLAQLALQLLAQLALDQRYQVRAAAQPPQDRGRDAQLARGL